MLGEKSVSLNKTLQETNYILNNEIRGTKSTILAKHKWKHSQLIVVHISLWDKSCICREGETGIV